MRLWRRISKRELPIAYCALRISGSACFTSLSYHTDLMILFVHLGEFHQTFV